MKRFLQAIREGDDLLNIAAITAAVMFLLAGPGWRLYGWVMDLGPGGWGGMAREDTPIARSVAEGDLPGAESPARQPLSAQLVFPPGHGGPAPERRANQGIGEVMIPVLKYRNTALLALTGAIHDGERIE